MEQGSRPLLQTRGHTHTSSTHMAISDGVTHCRAAMVLAPAPAPAPAPVPAPAPAPVPAPVPGRHSHCATRCRASRCAGTSRGRAVAEPWLSCGLAATRGAQAAAPQPGSPGREGGTRRKARLVRDLQRERCPQLLQPRCPAPANERAGKEGWRDTRMPWHAPVPAPGSRHPSHPPRRARLPAPQGLAGPRTRGGGPGHSLWDSPQPQHLLVAQG